MRMKKKTSISELHSTSPIMQLLPNVLLHERESILCIQSHTSGTGIGLKKRSGTYAHSLNLSRFQSR